MSDQALKLGPTVHGMSLLAGLVAFIGAVALNCRGDAMLAYSGMCGFGYSATRWGSEYGWPWTFAEGTYDGRTAPLLWAAQIDRFDIPFAGLNLIAGIAIGLAVAVFCELHTARRGSLCGFTLKDIGATVAVVAVLLGWIKFEQKRSDEAFRIQEALLERNIFSDVVDETPTWLRRLPGIGDRSLFDRVSRVRVDHPIDDEEAEWLAGVLGSVRSITSFYFPAASPNLTDEGVSRIIGENTPEAIQVRGDGIRGDFLADLPAGSLRELAMGDCAVDDDALASLARQSNLEAVELYRNPMTNAGLKFLLSCPHLREMNIFGTAIDNDAIDTLRQFPELESVTLPNDGSVQLEAIERLREALPDVSITVPPLGHGPTTSNCMALPAPVTP